MDCNDSCSVAPSSVSWYSTDAGTSVSADIWFQCFGVTPISDYLVGPLAAARTPDGFVEVTEHLQVVGHETVFAVGDISTADVKMAGPPVGRRPSWWPTSRRSSLARED
jgi:NADH dehydrogenase FAD-containing subunit